MRGPPPTPSRSSNAAARASSGTSGSPRRCSRSPSLIGGSVGAFTAFRRLKRKRNDAAWRQRRPTTSTLSGRSRRWPRRSALSMQVDSGRSVDLKWRTDAEECGWSVRDRLRSGWHDRVATWPDPSGLTDRRASLERSSFRRRLRPVPSPPSGNHDVLRTAGRDADARAARSPGLDRDLERHRRPERVPFIRERARLCPFVRRRDRDRRVMES